MTTAAPIEVKKIAYRQSAKDGLVITFAVHPNDMPAALAAAPIGARFMCALVEIDDDENPKASQQQGRAPSQAGKYPRSGETDSAQAETAFREKERRAWATLTPTVQAGIRCQDPIFQAYVREHRKFDEEEDSELNAARFVRRQCNVNTRSALATNEQAAKVWRSIDADYQGWKLAESM